MVGGAQEDRARSRFVEQRRGRLGVAVDRRRRALFAVDPTGFELDPGADGPDVVLFEELGVGRVTCGLPMLASPLRAVRTALTGCGVAVLFVPPCRLKRSFGFEAKAGAVAAWKRRGDRARLAVDSDEKLVRSRAARSRSVRSWSG